MSSSYLSSGMTVGRERRSVPLGTKIVDMVGSLVAARPAHSGGGRILLRFVRVAFVNSNVMSDQ